jgi:hypothetical protein
MKCEHCGFRPAMRAWIVCLHCFSIFFDTALAKEPRT